MTSNRLPPSSGRAGKWILKICAMTELHNCIDRSHARFASQVGLMVSASELVSLDPGVESRLRHQIYGKLSNKSSEADPTRLNPWKFEKPEAWMWLNIPRCLRAINAQSKIACKC